MREPEKEKGFRVIKNGGGVYERTDCGKGESEDDGLFDGTGVVPGKTRVLGL